MLETVAWFSASASAVTTGSAGRSETSIVSSWNASRVPLMLYAM